MKKNSITEFEMEREGFKIKLKRGTNGGMVPVIEDMPTALGYQPLPQAQAGPAPAQGASLPGEVEIKSPMIGTFYRSPSPDSGSYVEVGAEVNAESIVC